MTESVDEFTVKQANFERAPRLCGEAVSISASTLRRASVLSPVCAERREGGSVEPSGPADGVQLTGGPRDDGPLEATCTPEK